MACPYFIPTHRMVAGSWPHAGRLPLGSGWYGRCGAAHGEPEPTEAELEQNCNLGYALNCSRLPDDRTADAVRFSIARERGQEVVLAFSREAAHLPVDHGTVTYDLTAGCWVSRHTDLRIQKMAECYLESYLQRKNLVVATAAAGE